jgi:hypothetical protein
VTRLNGGFVVARYRGGFEWEKGYPHASDIPEWAPNSAIEKTLRERVRSLSEIDMRFEADVTGFTQDEDGVTVTYRDAGGSERSVTGAYLVAADGSRSVVRHALWVRMEGRPNLARALFWYIHAPTLKDFAKETGLAVFTWFVNEDRSGLTMVPQDADGHYTIASIPVPDGVDPDNWESVRQYLYRNIGAEFPVEPEFGGTVTFHSLMAPKYDHGRVFLAGDAAHLISPMGGLGMNIGIGDAADLGWKLAAVLQGWGGERLLSAYSDERREAEGWLLRCCIENTEVLGPELARDRMEEASPRGEQIRGQVRDRILAEKTQEFVSPGGQLGYQYVSSPIVAKEDGPPPQPSFAAYTPSAYPGCRAPHVWLADGSSLYDHFGSGFTLLKLADVDTKALEDAAARRYVPLKVLEPRHDGLDKLYEATIALVRPDQHVAWRGNAMPDDSLKLIDLVRGA